MEFPRLSSRAVAEMCGVHQDMVIRLRQVSDSDTSTTTGKDGKQYPAKRRPRGKGHCRRIFAFR